MVAVRNPAKGRAVAKGIARDTEVRELDISSLSSVRAFASSWHGPIDVLINNAGIMQVPEARTADGFELQFGTNHLGHFALTNLLLPQIRGRIVTLSSDFHRGGKVNVEDANGGDAPTTAARPIKIPSWRTYWSLANDRQVGLRSSFMTVRERGSVQHRSASTAHRDSST